MRARVIKILSAVIAMALLITGCSAGNTQNKGNTNTPSATAAPSPTAAGTITEDQARSIALQHAGVAEADVTSMRVKREIDNGIERFDVEFYTKDREYDYEIETATGKILKADNEIEESHQGGTVSVSEADARAMALEKVPGATESNLRMSLDREDNAYEGEIIYNGREYEFKINAQNGNFIKWEEESAHD